MEKRKMVENGKELDFQIYEISKDGLAKIVESGNWDEKLKGYLEIFVGSIGGASDDIAFSEDPETGELRLYIEESLFKKLQDMVHETPDYERKFSVPLPC